VDVAVQLAGQKAPEVLRLARIAEEKGFSSVYVPDHLANEPPGSGALDETILPEAISMIAAIAAVTERVRIGGHVLCNLFRHPATTAQAMATIDQISGGRALLGIGAGWTRNEFEMTGIDFPDIGPRLRMLDEACQIIRSLWTQRRTSFTGEFYKLQDAFLAMQPVTRPHPPILLGGSGKGLLRLAARHADIVNIIVDVGKAGTTLPSEIAKLTEDGFRKKIDFVVDEATHLGRSLTLSATIFIPFLAGTEEEAQQMAEGLAAGFGLDAGTARRMPLTLIGTPEQCVEELRRREREWGVEHLILSGGVGEDLLRRFGDEILPHI
jgi:probable F420-dependent oxidoreductase